MNTDIVVVGAGIVGLATAFVLCRREPKLSLTVVEKESTWASHQSGRNSGVLHSGIYYRPGSHRARLCRQGRTKMVEFCRQEGIAHDVCGKVIVAVEESEVARLRALAERARQNAIRAILIDPRELGELEPHAAGLAALSVPDTGIVDYRQVCSRLVERITQSEGSSAPVRRVLCSARVTRVATHGKEVEVVTTGGTIHTRQLINCAGLHSDRVARLSGQRPSVSIVPFKGEYFELAPAAQRWVNNLIYPVPDPRFPFLGVHFTRTTEGTIECGPNALLALGREAYEPWRPSLGDLAEMAHTPGFWRFATRNWRAGWTELRRSMSRRGFARALARLVPGLESGHLRRAPAGIRAQALARDGSLVDDFVFDQTPGVLSVCNAPSPAATASLAIAENIADRVLARLA